MRRKASAAALVAMLVAALALRVAVAARAYTTTFDTATPGLMALHILRGERPLFFYGQTYMGALEAYLAALLFKLFGVSDMSLCLSPILFSLAWIGATYLLFRELADDRAGLAAAAVVAFPGWQTLWYNIGSYGGYPATFFLGTLALALAVRLALRPLPPGILWAHVLGMGFVSGLALWTNFQAGSYLATAAVPILVHLWRARFSPRALAPFAAGAGFFLLGFWPILAVRGGHRLGGQLAQWNFSPHYLCHTLRVMVRGELRFLILPDIHMPVGLKSLAFTLIGLGFCLYVVRLKLAANAVERARLLIPALYAAVFVALFLPHAMAWVRAPRYVISFWTMVSCALFALPVTLSQRGLRRAATALLAGWALYQLAGDVVMAERAAPRRREKIAQRQRLIATAERLAVTNVVMVGGEIFGLEGQPLSWEARDRIHFVSAFGERCAAAAQDAEADPRAALACEGGRTAKVRRALDDLGVRYRVVPDWISLFHDLEVPARTRRAVPRGEMRVMLHGPCSGHAEALVDRVLETKVSGSVDFESGFTVDLKRERVVDSLWLWPAHPLGNGLPERYRLSVSRDGHVFQTVKQSPAERMAVAYTCGRGVYVKDYHGWFEVCLEPVTCRYLRCEIGGAVGTPSWAASELYVFERAGEDSPLEEAEVDALAAAIVAKGVAFTIADRWLSAQLLKRLDFPKGKFPAFPRFNPKDPRTLLPREVRPHSGLALVVARGLEDECAELLEEFCGGRPWEIIGFPHYVAFVFRSDAPRAGERLTLKWVGATLLRTTAEKLPEPSEHPDFPVPSEK